LRASTVDGNEAITFRQLGIESDDLDTLQSIVTGNRRKYLAKISFTALLPEYSDEACAQEETRDEQQANYEAFTQGINDLFAILKAWEDDGVHRALHLDLRSAASPTDRRVYKGHDLMYNIAIGMRKDILSARWESSRLQLLMPDVLPLLLNVHYLRIDGSGSRRLVPLSAPDLAMSLPNLNSVEWDFHDCDAEAAYYQTDHDSSDSESDSELEVNSSEALLEARGKNRMDFADRLRNTQYYSLSAAHTFYHAAPIDQRRTCPSIVPMDFSFDPFSAALRMFSQNLTTLTLNAHLDSTLFWPSPDEQDALNPSWPHLKSLDVEINMISPSGDWYFTGPRPADHEDDDAERGIIGDADREYDYTNFRVHPDPQTFDPFLAAFAKAVAKMPVLEYFMLTSELTEGTAKLHILYNAPGKEAEFGDEGPEDLQCRRIYYACEVGKVWVPEAETAEGLKGAGKEKFGGEAIERYVGSQYY
tara:strand:- start:14001 stop:15425 length:1425 start_codon:yes stop_codon:yes gene_type:complete